MIGGGYYINSYAGPRHERRAAGITARQQRLRRFRASAQGEEKKHARDFDVFNLCLHSSRRLARAVFVAARQSQ